MPHTIKKLPKSEIELKITVSPEEMAKHRARAFEELAKEVDIKGFRKGHVPANIIEQHVDKAYIEGRTKEIAIQRSYADTVIKEKIDVVARPKVTIDTEEPLSYTAIVATMPIVELKDYKSLKIKKEEAKVTDKDIDEVVEDMKKYSTTYSDVERTVQKGDRVELDFEGFDEGGAAIDNTKSKNHPLVVGEGTLIPGFEDHLVGMKKDEKKEFPLTFPKDYHKKDFQEKKVKFKVEVKRVEEAKLPEFNEDLIEKATGRKQTPEEFKKEIGVNILARKEEQARQKQESDYIEKLMKEAKIELPDSLIEEESGHILNEIKDDIQAKGIEFAKFLEQTKNSEEKLLEKYRPEAERRLKIRLVIQHLLKAEEIKVIDEEINAELDKIKANYPASEHPKIQEEYEKGALANQLVNRIALKKLFDIVLA